MVFPATNPIKDGDVTNQLFGNVSTDSGAAVQLPSAPSDPTGDCDFWQLMNEYGEHVETSERDWCFFEAYEAFRITYPASAVHTERDQTKRYQPSASARRGLQANRKPNQ